MKKDYFVKFFLILLLNYFGVCFAQSSTTPTNDVPAPPKIKNPVQARQVEEEKIPPNYFALGFYKPTYVLPLYFTGSPDNTVYKNNNSNAQTLKHTEIKYQLSFKVPVWKNIFNCPTSLFVAYTQLSYWQAYNHTAFFRETDYEPELFFANELNRHLFSDWRLSFVNLGAVHQSNGYGGTLERSWNRIYLEAISSREHWMVSLKPWYVIHDHTMNESNPNIARYLGYGEALISYKHGHQVFSFMLRNMIESGGRRSAAELTWSFPITYYIKGYVQVFSGYGQSLIEYNHRTNSAGIGFALSDWV